MPVTLLASDCPLPIEPSALVWPSDVADGDSAGVAKTIGSGEANFTSKVNENAAMLDMAARGGGGCFAVVYGGELSAGEGLHVLVSGVVAAIDGYKAVKEFQPLEVPAATARVWIWFKQDGTLEAVATDPEPPAVKCVLLGSCTTNGSDVTAVDESGVVRLVSGMPYRETADLGQPSDTPGAAIRLLTKTLGGLWLWDGAQWANVPQGMAWSKDVIPAGETVVIPGSAQASMFGAIAVLGTLIIRGSMRVTE
ncbi:MAG TPA: hypothetical protein PLV39_13985 [Fimbriimonadaceae bacterium]|nr:hypothetical protein [Fimbriimonadaceae bacterium]